MEEDWEEEQVVPQLNFEYRQMVLTDKKQFKNLCSLLLPSPRPKTFYDNIMTEYVYLATVNGNMIGFIGLTAPEEELHAKVSHSYAYIDFFAVLVQFRRRGLGTRLLQEAIQYVRSHRVFLDMALHVEKDNEEAIKLYKKEGFEVIGEHKNYYPRMACPDALIMHLNTKP